MYNRLMPNQVQLFSRLSFVAKLKEPVIEAWLPLTNQARQTNGGTHVGKRIMGGFVPYTISCSQILKPETGPAIIMPGPGYAIRPQGIGHAH